jgi:hypothetical protein
VSNSTGGYTSTASYTPTAVGDYYWIASFAGDGGNSPATGSCTDANEHSVVTKTDSTISTSEVLVPNDNAQVTPSSATGTITFYLFKPSQTCSVANAGTAVYTEAVTPLTSGGATTTNSDDTDTLAGTHADALGTWHWLVRYGGDDSRNGSDSVCTEAFSISEG